MDFPDGFCCFVPSVKRPVDFTAVQFAGHCNQVDVIPALEWTQVSVALGDFVALNIFISPKLVVQYIHDKARTKLT